MKAKITITFEYELNPEHYRKYATPEEMLADDLENFNDDPLEAVAMFSDSCEVKGELIG